MDDLKLIKKHYGENMMHLCRKLFPTILETEGLLFNILKEEFAYSKFLYEDLKQQNLFMWFKDYIYNLIDIEENNTDIYKTPKELLSEAEYILYECKTEEDIQKFKKYYAKNERLCTFQGGRLNSCYVFFAVKKNVDEIKRENFSTPKRQDEYGTSVISIQFSKGKNNTLSIKNRYNHRVNNPDATFSNNLENIIPGLTNSFEKMYQLKINQNKTENFKLNGYVLANDGKYYKYNHEINNIYYGPNNTIIKCFEVITKYQEKEKYLVIDYFIIDLVNKKIELIDYYCKDSFLDELKSINKINIINNEKNKTIKIIYMENRECIIEIDKYNRIVKYENKFIETIEDNFLNENKTLKQLNLPKVKNIGNYFLYKNQNLKELNLPSTEMIGRYFLQNNKDIESLNLPEAKLIENSFLCYNQNLKELNLPKVEKIGHMFLKNNQNLKELNFPNVKKIGHYFLYNNQNIKKANLPNVEKIMSGFLRYNQHLKEINLPNVEVIGNEFLSENESINKVILPKLKTIGEEFLCSIIDNIEYIYIPNLSKESVAILNLDKNNKKSRI